MHTRLKKWMDSEGLKSSQLADNIGVNRATISHILSGRNKPSIDFFEKLLRVYTRLNSNWLITGIGYMSTQKEVKFSKKIDKVVSSISGTKVSIKPMTTLEVEEEELMKIIEGQRTPMRIKENLWKSRKINQIPIGNQ